MHGLVNRSIQCFLRDTYGNAQWQAIAVAAGAPPEGFEGMLEYDDEVTEALLTAAQEKLAKPRAALLEDLGIHLVSHPGFEPLRRLLRFGGVGFEDFLHSLEDLQGRGRLAVPDLELPRLELHDHEEGRYSVSCHARHPVFVHVVAGVLRAMADDYGALVLIDVTDAEGPAARLDIDLLDQRFAQGRSFQLAPAVGGGS